MKTKRGLGPTQADEADVRMPHFRVTGHVTANRGGSSLLCIATIACLGVAWTTAAMAQSSSDAVIGRPKSTNSEKVTPAIAPAKVDVNPVARDEEISKRLHGVLNATGWFTRPRVEVREGVVFLNGRTKTNDLKNWAGELARNTQDVVAVANRMEIIEPSVWDFSPALDGLLILWRDIIRSLPFFLFALVVLALSAGVGLLAAQGTRSLLRSKVQVSLLRNVMARTIGVLVFLCGVYIILRVSGLTQLALTVVGGTGLIGLAVGIAFRDITENFLASIFLSMQQPFETGDLVEITGVTGYVQQLNVRTTILMTLDGNLVQIPNASVYKNNLRNFTTNANRRESFVVGIGYDRAADICIVSSLHDGMNLVAKEFVAARDDEQGILLLSSFAGASRELSEALIVNPYDTHGMAEALAVALNMPATEQRERMRLMRDLVRQRNVYRWAAQMLLDAARLRRREKVIAGALPPTKRSQISDIQ